MLKMPITYTNFDGEEKTKVFEFNLTKSELIEWELMREGSEPISEYVRGVVERGKGNELMEMFLEFLKRSYGERSEDGEEFNKDNGEFERFKRTAAYDVFFTRLCTEADLAAQFMNDIFPKDMQATIDKAIANGRVENVPAPEDLPAYKRENRKPTKVELMAMEKHELVEAMQFEPKSENQEAPTDES